MDLRARNDNSKPPSDTPIADSMAALNEEIRCATKGALDLLLKKQGAPTLDELMVKACDFTDRLLELDSDSVVLGGLSTGSDIPLDYRKTKGTVPTEISSKKLLNAYKARFDKLDGDNDNLMKMLSELRSISKDERNDKRANLELMITAGILVPVAIVGLVGTVVGGEDKVFFVTLLGSTIVAGAGVGAVMIKRTAQTEPANDNKHARQILSDYRKAQYRSTRQRSSIRAQAAAFASSLCRKRKPFTKTSEPLMLLQTVDKCIRRLKVPKGPHP